MSQRSGWSIRRLRTLILVALVACVSLYTVVMFSLVRHLSERFGPQVRADLEWRAARGAQELAKSADLGLAVGDAAMVTEAFGAIARASDVLAIVAVDSHDRVIARHGSAPEVARFPGHPGELFTGEGFIASWARSEVEGNAVGKVVLFVSTARLSDAEALLDNVSATTVIAGGVGLVLGVIGVLFFTRAVAIRDRRLNEYARTLEAKVDERTRELDERNRNMQLVLDNVAQGFIRIDLRGTMASERSAIVGRWFGDIAADANFADVVGAHDEHFATWFTLGLDALRDGYLPIELCIDQMPSRFVLGDRTLEVTYTPLADQAHMLLIVSDVTAQVAREHTEQEQRELVAVFQRVTADRAGFVEFLDEANALIDTLAGSIDELAEKRAIHTLKGNCAIYGVETFAALCHEIESELEESCQRLSPAQRERLQGGWRSVCGKLTGLLGSARNVVEIEPGELQAAIDLASRGAANQELAAMLGSWRHEPVARQLERLGEHAKGLARRLGKAELAVGIEAPASLRIDGAAWAPFWAAMVHAVRNAIDHGIETTDERVEAGKPACGRIDLTVSCTARELAISIADDGAGIRWDALREKAQRLGLPAETERDLVEALFTDGVSTSAEATDISGRGVGMAALREAVRRRGGEIDVTSRGIGTRITCRFAEPSARIGRGRRSNGPGWLPGSAEST